MHHVNNELFAVEVITLPDDTIWMIRHIESTGCHKPPPSGGRDLRIQPFLPSRALGCFPYTWSSVVTAEMQTHMYNTKRFPVPPATRNMYSSVIRTSNMLMTRLTSRIHSPMLSGSDRRRRPWLAFSSCLRSQYYAAVTLARGQRLDGLGVRRIDDNRDNHEAAPLSRRCAMAAQRVSFDGGNIRATARQTGKTCTRECIMYC